MQRRNFLKGAAALLGTIPLNSALSAEAAPVPASSVPDASAHLLSGSRALAPIIASPDRIIEMNVCTRPFRLQGPRIESERIGRKNVVHNYGHGGSGWSLSWGTGQIAVEMAKAHGRRELAVIGCGAIGLTTALVAQQAGLKVTIYAKERPPYVSSHRATGSFTPDSRIVSAQFAPDFARQWETMARYSFRRFQSYLGVGGNPIEWRDMYSLSDVPFGSPRPAVYSPEPAYPGLEREMLRDITPRTVTVSSHPFPVPYVQRRPALLFNIAEYTRLLMAEFFANGGVIETFEMQDKRDFAAIHERTIINCTGYGARALLADDSIIPVRGQTAKLIPQPEVDYGFFYGGRRVSVYPRRDGLLVQAQAEGDFNNDSEALDPEESISAVQRLAEIVAMMRSTGYNLDKAASPE
ncbi:MAG: FAD-dependent oxidoreductase [Pseudohongiella sp.]|nr:FAD-dependent oxidoreductase [Pseudohongiella sp.]